jgi:Ferric reductase NAD binding domain
VVVLVGAGIGVTPFASVLADMVNKLESGVCSDCGNVQHVTAGSGAHVEKIYFRENPFLPGPLEFCS